MLTPQYPFNKYLLNVLLLELQSQVRISEALWEGVEPTQQFYSRKGGEMMEKPSFKDFQVPFKHGWQLVIAL